MSIPIAVHSKERSLAVSIEIPNTSEVLQSAGINIQLYTSYGVVLPIPLILLALVIG